jgi:hypothetical protein
MNKWLIGAALLAITTLNVSAEQGWITQSKIEKIVVTNQGGINVRITPELTSCTSQSGYGPRYASVYPSHVGIDKIHATLLAAYVADKPIALYLSDSTCKILEVELGGR